MEIVASLFREIKADGFVYAIHPLNVLAFISLYLLIISLLSPLFLLAKVEMINFKLLQQK